MKKKYEAPIIDCYMFITENVLNPSGRAVITESDIERARCACRGAEYPIYRQWGLLQNSVLQQPDKNRFLSKKITK